MTAPVREDVSRAFAELRGRWEDEAAHRAFLDRLGDLEGLAAAGGLYRGVLAERPDDAVARRWCDEVVKRATVAGIASLPRTRDRWSGVPRWARLGLAWCVASLLVWLAAWALDLFSRGTP